MLSKLKGFVGSTLKLVGLATVADKVTEFDEKTSWLLLGGIGIVAFMILKGRS